MTKEFDKRNMAKSRRVCEDMEAAHVTKWLKLTERERQILAMWPRFEDGECVWLGDKYEDNEGNECFASGVHLDIDGPILVDSEGFHDLYRKGKRVKRPAPKVLDADGVEIEAGDTVYGIGRTKHRFEVIDPHHIDQEVGEAFSVRCYDRDELEECHCKPKLLAHTRQDSWERLEEDAADLDDMPCDFNAKDLVRRAKALAGAEAGR